MVGYNTGNSYYATSESSDLEARKSISNGIPVSGTCGM